MMQHLPNEIILFILIRLNDGIDLISFTSTCQQLYSLRTDELFWRDLIQRKHKIKYCDPTQTWWNLSISGDAKSMCHHISRYNMQNLETKRKLLWHQFGNHDICLLPTCQLFTCCNEYSHSIVLKLSRLHFMEIWCHACRRSIGFGSNTKSEKYMSRQIINFMTEHPTLAFIQSKKLIEQSLFSIQNDHYQFIIEKSWFMSWIHFLTGESTTIPTSLDNTILFKQGKLKKNLIIAQFCHFICK
ncbi:hypothetical protein BDF21DRAFT_494936 [Thamnidium elegans]|uniref:F-box domain-containing protein n=1 Tax=Thamnidium elegans TaxID=101142 RepID=A0A8H7SPA0_9FUNG|nr:hypothetical protein INT48_008252 [Thamnidium elegans]KAI8076201.1 hypothetical protein BDF21DRAFT_494936 [Thamnidium elegans]